MDSDSVNKGNNQLHIFFFPFIAPGHYIPMIDMAKIIAAKGAKVSIATTTQIMSRFKNTLLGDQHLTNHNINLYPLVFIDSPDLNQSNAIMMLQPQADDLIHQHQPDAIISDFLFTWTVEIARKYGIPRLCFHGTCCFSLSLGHFVTQHMPNINTISSDTEPFLVPDLPDPIYITKSQMPYSLLGNVGLQEFFQKVEEFEKYSYGVVANTFFELEPKYIELYEKSIGKKVWPVGPVSLVNTKSEDISERGNRAVIDDEKCLTWLNSKPTNSVIYVCFGSLCRFAKSQILEIGLGLVSSKSSFIWVIKDDQETGLLPQGFDHNRGLIIKGWVPQLVILNHPAIGVFMTHCGWNSVLESVCAGVPLITWPLFAEQFYNENLVLNVLKIGVGIGVESGLPFGEEENVGVLVTRERVEESVNRFMSGGDVVEQMRKRVSELSELAKRAVSEIGSSKTNMDGLLEELLNIKKERLARTNGV